MRLQNHTANDPTSASYLKTPLPPSNQRKIMMPYPPGYRPNVGNEGKIERLFIGVLFSILLFGVVVLVGSLLFNRQPFLSCVIFSL